MYFTSFLTRENEIDVNFLKNSLNTESWLVLFIIEGFLISEDKNVSFVSLKGLFHDKWRALFGSSWIGLGQDKNSNRFCIFKSIFLF
jgi:hypothetical protein